MAKVSTSLRLNPETKRMLEKLAERKGVSQTAVIELLIRAEATREGLRK